jgi:hypothetical protein
MRWEGMKISNKIIKRKGKKAKKNQRKFKDDERKQNVWDLRVSRLWLCRMPPSGTWRRVSLVRTHVSEERVTSIFRVEEQTVVCKAIF